MRAACKPFDVGTILSDDAAIAEQHPLVVDLTQHFGRRSEENISAHLRGQQDTMCDDIIKELENKVPRSVSLSLSLSLCFSLPLSLSLPLSASAWSWRPSPTEPAAAAAAAAADA